MALFPIIVMSAVGCAGPAQDSRSTVPASLSPRVDAPNWVSTKSEVPGHAMPPLPYFKSGRESMDRLVRIVQEMKRAMNK